MSGLAGDSVFPAGTPRIRLGIWGLGRGLSMVPAAALCHFDVVGGCDFNPHFLELFQREIPEGRFTPDGDEFLSWDFDAVLLATHLPTHARDAIRCLQAGKHVLSEVTAFLTPAEGVALVEAVEASGRVYQLAENYPFTPENRCLKRLWGNGVFGDFQYAEFSYLHDCLNHVFSYHDGTPVNPGDHVHSWRSWLPWHYYCTHTLGPLVFITGHRPVRVTALPGAVRLPGHVMEPPSGLAGMAPSLVQMDNGGLCRSLMGSGTNDGENRTLYGNRGSAEWIHGRLSLRLGGRGHSPMLEVQPQEQALDRLAASTGHGGADFWVFYHFANQILHGIPAPFDIHRACDITLPGIMACRSAVAGGVPLEVPDFRDPEARALYRNDHLGPPVYDVREGLFCNSSNPPERLKFTALVGSLLKLADRWRPFLAWSEVGAELVEPERLEPMADEALEVLPALREAVASARRLIAAAPGTDAARVLTEILDPLHLALVESPEAEARLTELRKAAGQHRRTRSLATDFPQLTMKRTDLDGLPELQVPDGCTLREADPDEADHWCGIISDAFGREFRREDWWQSMVNRYDYALDRILFLCDGSGHPVGTASAYGGIIEGYVHFVGVRSTEKGRGFGRLLTLAVLWKFAERGCHHAVLSTDAYRLAAIKTYAGLGFRPWITHKSHPDRWHDVADKLAQPGLLADWLIDDPGGLR